MEEALKKLYSQDFRVLREVVTYVNNNHIQKEDILSIMKEGESIILLFYK